MQGKVNIANKMYLVSYPHAFVQEVINYKPPDTLPSEKQSLGLQSVQKIQIAFKKKAFLTDSLVSIRWADRCKDINPTEINAETKK